MRLNAVGGNDWVLLDFTSINLPLGLAAASAVDWLRSHADWLWATIKLVMESLVDGIERGLLALPPLILVVVLGLVAWRVSRLANGLFTLVSFTLINIMDLWEPAMRTLALIVAASLIAIIFGIPIGILASRYRWVSTVVRPVLDFMQTMPPFVYLIPAIFFFQLGVVPGAVATLVFAMPPSIRLTELGIRQVPYELIEAGRAFGATSNQLLFKIQLPLALPTIMAGVNQVIMLALSMAVIAGMVGAGGLGAEVIRSVATLDIALGFEAGLSVVILAIFLDRLTEGLVRRLQRSQSLASTR